MNYAVYIDDPEEKKPSDHWAVIYRYHMIRNPDNFVWLYRDGDGAADNIYCGSDDPNNPSGGLDNITITFILTNGDSITLYGPWHTNAELLLANTGIDLTAKYNTFVVIGRFLKHKDGRAIIQDVLYKDDQFTEGRFDRGNIKAQEIANNIKETVVCYSRSTGGYGIHYFNPK